MVAKEAVDRRRTSRPPPRRELWIRGRVPNFSSVFTTRRGKHAYETPAGLSNSKHFGFGSRQRSRGSTHCSTARQLAHQPARPVARPPLAVGGLALANGNANLLYLHGPRVGGRGTGRSKEAIDPPRPAQTFLRHGCLFMRKRDTYAGGSGRPSQKPGKKRKKERVRPTRPSQRVGWRSYDEPLAFGLPVRLAVPPQSSSPFTRQQGIGTRPCQHKPGFRECLDSRSRATAPTAAER